MSPGGALLFSFFSVTLGGVFGALFSLFVGTIVSTIICFSFQCVFGVLSFVLFVYTRGGSHDVCVEAEV